MKRRIMITFILVLMVCLYGCSENDSSTTYGYDLYEQSIVDSEVEIEESNQSNSEEQNVIDALLNIPSITGVEIADADEESGTTDTLDECVILAYFSSDLVKQDEIEGDSITEKGTKCGGSVEIFDTKEAAKYRDKYLDGGMISLLSPGTHAVKDKIVVRISKEISEAKREELEEKIFNALLSEGVKEEIANSNKIEMPESSYYYEGQKYKEVIKSLKKLGFTNISKKCIYNLEKNRWDAYDVDKVESVSIAGKKDFDDGDVFDKTSKVVIKYHGYEMDNPNISYVRYNAETLLQELRDNKVRAEKNHTNEYVEIVGTINEIEEGVFTINTTTWASPWDSIACDLITEEQEEYILNLNVGDTVTVRGKMVGVDIIYPYQMEVYSIS